MPCLKLLNDVDCLKFPGTDAQMLALKVDIDSTPNSTPKILHRQRFSICLENLISLSITTPNSSSELLLAILSLSIANFCIRIWTQK